MPKKEKIEVKCKCCNVTVLTKGNISEVCSSCKSNKSLTITATNVKKTYGLSDEELDTNNFFSFDVKTRNGGYGRKFFVKEIDAYVAKEIENGNEKFNKKKKKADEKLIVETKTSEINNFVNKNIVNCTHPNITEIKNEYVMSKFIKLDDIKDKLIEEDKKIAIYQNNYTNFFSSLTEILAEKINITNFKTEFGINEKDLSVFKTCNVYKTIAINHDFEAYYSQNLFNNTINTVGEIIKTHIPEIIYAQIINDLKLEAFRVIRQGELTNLLKSKNLVLRSDSKLCQYYIKGGLTEVNNNMDNAVTSVNEIVDIMEEMNFYHKFTNYPLVNKEYLHDNSIKVYDDDDDDDDDYNYYNRHNHYRYHQNYHYEYIIPISDINLMAKKDVLKKINKDLLKNAPSRVTDLYQTINKKYVSNNISNNFEDKKPQKIKKHSNNITFHDMFSTNKNNSTESEDEKPQKIKKVSKK